MGQPIHTGLEVVPSEMHVFEWCTNTIVVVLITIATRMSCCY